MLKFLDARDRLRGIDRGLTPPRSLHYVGSSDFESVGKTFFGHFKEVGGLQAEHHVLDIGCGTGRMAIPLLNYINEAGAYTGFDVARQGVAWCQKNITSRHSGFNFVHADVINDEYNPAGNIAADEFQFPVADGSQDFSFATSVFTHMRTAEVEHYLREIRRTLRPEGQAMLTFYLLDDEAKASAAKSAARPDFAHELSAGCYTIDLKMPERAIAFSLPRLHSMLDDAGLELCQPILFGSWSGRAKPFDFQDIILVH